MRKITLPEECRPFHLKITDGEEVDIAGKVIYGYSEQLHNELPGGYFQPSLIVDEILRR